MNSGNLTLNEVKDIHTYLTKENKVIVIIFFCRPIDTYLHMEVLGGQDEKHDSDTLDMIHKIDKFDLVDIFVKGPYPQVLEEILYHHVTPPIDGVKKVDEVLHSFMSSIVFDSI